MEQIELTTKIADLQKRVANPNIPASAVAALDKMIADLTAQIIIPPKEESDVVKALRKEIEDLGIIIEMEDKPKIIAMLKQEQADLLDIIQMELDSEIEPESSTLPALADTSSVYDDIVSKAKKLDVKTDRIKSHVRKTDIEKLVDIGYNKGQIETIYLGYHNTHDVKCDFEDMANIFSMSIDYIDTIINELVEVKEKNQFELGLKYPKFNWKPIIEKYNISTTPEYLTQKNRLGGEDYVYEIFTGTDVVFSKMLRDIDTKSEDLAVKFNSGYLAILSSKTGVLEDIMSEITSQEEGYVKDVDIYINNLSGLPVDKVVEQGIKFGKGGIAGSLYSTYTNPLEYLKAMGAKVDSDLNYSTEKNGINYYIGRKDKKSIVVAFIEDENNYMIDKEDAREMSKTADMKGVETIELYTNYGIELKSKEIPSVIGFDKVYKVSHEYAEGGTVDKLKIGEIINIDGEEWKVDSFGDSVGKNKKHVVKLEGIDKDGERIDGNFYAIMKNGEFEIWEGSPKYINGEMKL